MASSSHLRGYYLLRADGTLGTSVQSKPDGECMLKLWEEAKKEVGVKPQTALLEIRTHRTTPLCPRLSPPGHLGRDLHASMGTSNLPRF